MDGHMIGNRTWFRTCEQNGTPAINPMTNLVLENTILVPNYSMRSAVEHYIAQKQAEIDERTLATSLEEVTVLDNTQTDMGMAVTMAVTAENETKKVYIPWYPMIACLGLLMIASMTLPLHVSFNTAPTAISSASTLHLSATYMHNGWISTKQYEQEKAKKEKELRIAQARQVKEENERQIRIDRLNHNRRYWVQREREERNDNQRKKQQQTLRVQRMKTKNQHVAYLGNDIYRWIVNVLLTRVHLGIFVDGLHAAKFLVSQPHFFFIVVVFIVYPFILLNDQRQKAIKRAMFLADKAARTARRENGNQRNG